VQGNVIGTNPGESPALGNGGAGVEVRGAWHEIGGTLAGAGNVIAFNGGPGVDIETTDYGSIVAGNRIFANGGLGIDLFNDGVTPNEPAGSATHNFPVLTVDEHGAVHGSLDSRPDSDFLIEFFANRECDPSGNGEGENFLGSIPVVHTDAAGHVEFTGPGAGPGEVITATATDVTVDETRPPRASPSTSCASRWPCPICPR
jgi:hypothetical protein